jgi:GMP synthase-like glutamine amidotransferase
MLIHCLQHEPGEGPGGVAHWAAARGHRIRATHLYRGDPEPGFEEGDWLVVLGGGMNVYDTDRHPWLSVERRLIRESVGAGRVVLGICLGSQLLASALGARVRRNEETEIGWFPVRKTAEGNGVRLFDGFPGEAEVFHWHGDTFDLPAGAVRVFASGACANQAFVVGRRTIGIQFHPEMTPAIAASIVEAEGDGLAGGRFVQPQAEVLRDGGRFARMNGWLFSLLDALAEERS